MALNGSLQGSGRVWNRCPSSGGMAGNEGGGTEGLSEVWSLAQAEISGTSLSMEKAAFIL